MQRLEQQLACFSDSEAATLVGQLESLTLGGSISQPGLVAAGVAEQTPAEQEAAEQQSGALLPLQQGEGEAAAEAPASEGDGNVRGAPVVAAALLPVLPA